jgi:Trypsin-co-occurring domain 2
VVVFIEEVDAMADKQPEVRLSSALETLRSDLETAWESGQGKGVRFRISEVTLTLQAVARLDKEGGGKLRWWVVEAGGGVTSGKETTQTLVLTLTPELYDAQGKLVGPLDVADEQAVPGG